ncbi:phosphoribosylanthranilate isomerase [Haliea sp. E17]|uniref:phosphoribosylanthranilate isomerase n=1 Tax=Haliea sp. E17 TaxID=3401576 RepID=UPI003AAE168A
MPRTRIKICGITRPEDARAVVEQGADALGLVFYPPSPRAVSLEQAREIVAEVPPFVTLVALFVDAQPEEVRQVAAELPIGLLQFHGDEAPAYCASFERPWIKAIRCRPDMDLAAEARRYTAARGVLLDAWQEGVPGGTGKSFDWRLVPENLGAPLVLAGGLKPENIGTAVASLRPFAVDVSGGVESAPGIKDARKVKEFIAAVRAADAQQVD